MEEESAKTFEEQLAEAEERGYQRGLNEQLASKMQEPAVWESNTPAEAETPREFQILASPRRSVWD